MGTDRARLAAVLIAMVREAPAVVGVLVFGWPVLCMALFFLADLWLAMTVRGALEIAYDPRNARAASGGFSGNLAFLGTLYGAIGLVTVAELWVALPAEEIRRFGTDGWRDPSFLASLGLLLVVQVADAARFRRRLDVRTAGEAETDALRYRTQWARSGLVAFGAAVLMPVAARLGQGAPAVALLLAAVNVLAEAFPSFLDRRLGLG
jgi:hypothetical protein